MWICVIYSSWILLFVAVREREYDLATVAKQIIRQEVLGFYHKSWRDVTMKMHWVPDCQIKGLINGSRFDRIAIVASNDDIVARMSCFNQDWFESTVPYLPYLFTLQCNAMQIAALQERTDTFILKNKEKMFDGKRNLHEYPLGALSSTYKRTIARKMHNNNRSKRLLLK